MANREDDIHVRWEVYRRALSTQFNLFWQQQSVRKCPLSGSRQSPPSCRNLYHYISEDLLQRLTPSAYLLKHQDESHNSYILGLLPTCLGRIQSHDIQRSSNRRHFLKSRAPLRNHELKFTTRQVEVGCSFISTSNWDLHFPGTCMTARRSPTWIRGSLCSNLRVVRRRLVQPIAKSESRIPMGEKCHIRISDVPSMRVNSKKGEAATLTTTWEINTNIGIEVPKGALLGAFNVGASYSFSKSVTNSIEKPMTAELAQSPARECGYWNWVPTLVR